MVFENITLFEPHFEGASFGPRFGGADDDESENVDTTEHADVESADGNRRRVVGPVVASLALAVIATLLVRRFRGGNEDGEQFELDESIEQSAD